MQLRLVLRGEGFKGNGNQTVWESHSNVCTVFLNFLQTSSVSIKHLVFCMALRAQATRVSEGHFPGGISCTLLRASETVVRETPSCFPMA